MFTENLIRHIAKTVILGSRLGYVPLTWSPGSNSFIVTSSKFGILTYVLSSLLLLLKSIECGISALRRVTAGGEVDVDMAIHVLYANACISVCAFNIANARYRKELAACFNNLLQLDKMTDHGQGTSENPRKKTAVVELIAKYFPILVANNVFCMVGMYLMDPFNLRYWFHFLHSGGWWSTLVFGLLEVQYLLFAYSIIGFNWFCILILFSYSLQSTLRKISNEVVACANGNHRHHWLKLQHTYNVVKTWSALYNDCIKFMWPIFIYMNVCNHVLFLYITIAYFDSLMGVTKAFFVMWTLLWPVVELCIYYIPGKVHEVSLKCMRSFEEGRAASDGGLHFKCLQRAMKPIKVRVGNAIPMDKYAPLLIISVVFEVTINLLLYAK